MDATLAAATVAAASLGSGSGSGSAALGGALAAASSAALSVSASAAAAAASASSQQCIAVGLTTGRVVIADLRTVRPRTSNLRSLFLSFFLCLQLPRLCPVPASLPLCLSASLPLSCIAIPSQSLVLWHLLVPRNSSSRPPTPLSIYVFARAQGDRLKTFDDHSQRVAAICAPAFSQQLFTAGYDGLFQVPCLPCVTVPCDWLLDCLTVSLGCCV